MLRSFRWNTLALLAFVLWVPAALAQIGGTGWSPLTVNFKIQSPTNVPQSARYFFTNNIYHCLTYSNDGAFAVGNTTKPRTEQRFNPDYTNGEIQYQAVMMAPSNENSYCVFQIHTGDAQSSTFGSTTFMLFWFTNYGGSVHDYSGTTLATNLGSQWFQLNVDHNLATGTIRVWVNQKLVWTQQDNGAGDFYMKDGVYEQDHNPTYQMDTFITNSIRMWISSGTNPPAAPIGLTATPTLSTIPLTWQSSVGATNYNLKRSTISSGSYTSIASLTGTSYTDTNAASGTLYYYVVTAVDQFGESTNSSQTSAMLVNPGYQLSAAPATVALVAGNSTNYTVMLTTNNGYGGLTTFGITGLPTGASASFNPAFLGASGNSTLTINTISNTIGGNYVLTIEGTNSAFTNSTTVNLLLTGVVANPGTLVWFGGGGTTINWSDVLNWTNVTAGGHGSPGISNDVVFTNLATVATSNVVDNVVDSDTPVASLTFNNTNDFHTAQIVPGATLLIAGSGGLTVGAEADLGSAATINAALTGTGGTLVVSNANASLVVRQGAATGGSQRATLDLSGLDSFDAALNQISIGVAGPVVRETGTLLLARTNVIVAGGSLGVLVGDNGSNAGGENYLYLGMSNAIDADTITIGRQKSSALLAFNPAFQNAFALFRGAQGVNRISTWNIGDNSAQSSSSSSTHGTVDLSGGTVDALVDTLVVGKSQKTTGADTFGVFTFSSGTVDVNTLQIGYQSQNGATSAGNGTVNVNGVGALLNVNTLLELGHTSGGTGATRTTGTLNLNGGTVTGTNFVGGGGLSTINLNSGILNALGGTIANVSTLNVGSNGVGDPALLTGAGSLLVSNTITVAPNGTLAGNTFVTAPGLVVNGTIAPGVNGVGAITNSAGITFGTGGRYAVGVQNALGAPISGWGYLQVGGALNVQATVSNPFMVQVQSLGPAGSGWVTNFNADTNYDWTVSTAAGGIANFDAGKLGVDTSPFQNDLAGGYFYVRNNGNALILSFTNNHPPVAATYWTYAPAAGLALAITNLAGNWSDPDGDPVVMTEVADTSTNGAGVSDDGNYLYYTNSRAVADVIDYTVADVRTNPPAVYRAGDTQRTAAGQVMLLPPPAIGRVALAGSSLELSGTGGIANGPYYVLASTNLATPLADWQVVATNAFDAAGSFQFTNTAAPGPWPTYFLLRLP